MSVGQDVERSMLERKDRADLVAMATALGEKPPARAKKADIVDLILRLTNVDADDAAPTAKGGAPADGSAPDDAGSRADGRPTAEATAGGGEAPGSGITTSDPAGVGLVGRVEPLLPGQAVDDRPASGPATSTAARGVDRGGHGSHGGTDPQGSGIEPSGVGQQRSRDRQGGTGDQGAGQQGGRGPQRVAPSDGDRASQGNRQAGVSQAEPANQAPPWNETREHQAQPGNEISGTDQNRGSQQGPKVDDGEPGNRRRRRRGRDRDRQGGEPDDMFAGEPVDVEGLLDLRDEGYGFLRLKGYLPSKDDVYVSVKQARQFSLRKGDRLTGKSRPASRNEKNPALLQIDSVNGAGADADKARQRPRFEDLTPLFPDEKLRLEMADDPTNMTARIVDLIAPIGKGQRGLIVSPPKAGKTTVMKQIARSIEINDPDVHLIVLLVDERPEEVTDMRRWLRHGEVAASTFDRPSDEHTAVAELVIERAKRMVEEGKDVVIILDGITRLARAYNLAAPATGRIMSGGIDTGALYPPKKFFGAARNVEEGGSLTILATALVETGSRMDEVIFEEFKGTGNMELKLDRRLADRRIYPAIDVDASSTRHEELLFERKQLQQVWRLRRVLSGLGGEGASSAAGLELLIDRMKTFKSNDEFLAEVAKAASV